MNDSENWNRWVANERYMAMQRVKNIKDGHQRTMIRRFPILSTTAKATEPFQTAVDQTNQPYRIGYASSMISGGAIPEEARKAIINERSYYQRNKRLGVRVPEVDRQRIIKRLGSDYSEFQNGVTTSDPYNLDQNYRNPTYAKTEANLLLEVIKSYVYNGNFNDELFKNLDKYFKLLWQIIPTYDDFGSYDMLVGTWEKMRDFVYNVVDTIDKKRKLNKYDPLSPEGILQKKEDSRSGFVYDYVNGIYHFLEDNRKGITKDLKTKKILLKSTIDEFKLPSKGFIGRESNTAESNLSKINRDTEISGMQANDINANVGPNRGELDELPGITEDIEDDGYTPEQRKRLRELLHRSKKDREALIAKITDELDDISGYFIDAHNKSDFSREDTDREIFNYFNSLSHVGIEDLPAPYIAEMIRIYTSYRQYFGEEPSADEDTEFWDKAKVAVVRYLHNVAQEEYAPERRQKQPRQPQLLITDQQPEAASDSRRNGRMNRTIEEGIKKSKKAREISDRRQLEDDFERDSEGKIVIPDFSRTQKKKLPIFDMSSLPNDAEGKPDVSVLPRNAEGQVDFRLLPKNDDGQYYYPGPASAAPAPAPSGQGKPKRKAKGKSKIEKLISDILTVKRGQGRPHKN